MSNVIYSGGAPASSLAELSIGNIPIGFPVVQAALSGYSDSPMRVLARRHGASYTLCEVMLDQFLVALRKRAKTRHLLYHSAEEAPVGGQLMGAEPEQFGAGAKKLVEAGFHVIDINFGCPVKKVLGRCRGGYHLGHPDSALQIIERVREAVPPQIPVTVKMRRGVDDSAESRDHFFRIVEGAFGRGIAAITVHGRTVEQKYVGPSRREFLREVKEFVGDRTILGSGDLFTARDCLDMIEQTGVDGVTVARGAIGNPWIFAEARALAAGEPYTPPSLAEQAAVMREHFSLSEQLYEPKRCAQSMRKFGIKYARLHPQEADVRQDFTRIHSREEWDTVIRKWYGE